MKHLLLVAVMATGSFMAVSAHHSYSAFDLDTPFEVAGVIELIELKSPHSLLRVRGDDKQLYEGEWVSVQGLARSGVGADTLAAGQRVVIGGFLKRDFQESRVLTLRTVRRPSDGWFFPTRSMWATPVSPTAPAPQR